MSRRSEKTRRAQGRCVRCGADAGGRSLCPTHARENGERSTRRTARLKAAGLCLAGCDSPVLQGYIFCAVHLERKRVRQNQSRKVRRDWTAERKAERKALVVAIAERRRASMAEDVRGREDD